MKSSGATQEPMPTADVAAVGSPPWWDEAVAYLVGCDPVLRELANRLPGERLVPRDDPFIALARAIVGQ